MKWQGDQKGKRKSEMGKVGIDMNGRQMVESEMRKNDKRNNERRKERERERI